MKKQARHSEYYAIIRFRDEAMAPLSGLNVHTLKEEHSQRFLSVFPSSRRLEIALIKRKLLLSETELHLTQECSHGTDRGWQSKQTTYQGGHSEVQRAAGRRSNVPGREGWLIPEGGWIATLFLDKSLTRP